MYHVDWHTDAAGDLVIERRDSETPRDLYEALEALTADDAYEWLQPEELGALTDTPILGYDVRRTDAGAFVSVGRVYWHPQYETRDALAELMAGRLVLQLAPEDAPEDAPEPESAGDESEVQAP